MDIILDFMTSSSSSSSSYRAGKLELMILMFLWFLNAWIVGESKQSHHVEHVDIEVQP